MLVSDLSQLVNSTSSTPTTTKLEVSEGVPELTQEFISWHETNIGPVQNAQLSMINNHLMRASSLAVRFTRNAVKIYLGYGVAWEDIEPLIKEGIFRYTAEQINPTHVSKNEKPIESAEAVMLEYYYSEDLVKA